MELRDRLYPYPVLAAHKDDYNDSLFDVSVKTEINKTSLDFTFTYTLLNENLWDLIQDKMAKVIVHIECPSTSFRSILELGPSDNLLSIESGKLNGTLQICSFIVAIENIEDFYDVDFNEVYGDTKFQIEKHNIIAIGSQVKIPIEKDYDEIKNLSSIFTVFENLDKKIEIVQRDFYQEKIIIKIPKEQFEKYKISIKNPKNHSYMHAMLILPILTEIIETLKKEDTWEELEDRRWFKSFEKTMRKNGIKFDEQSIKGINTFEFIQEITASPVIKSLETLFEQSLIHAGDDDDE